MKLSNDRLLELNTKMLGLGAPIDIDGVGYNKFHYSKMAGLAYRTELTDTEAYAVACTLLTYSNTQLASYADDLKDTVKEYQKALKEVKVVNYDVNKVSLSWKYNSKISDFIKTLDRANIRWTRPNGEWVLEVKWTGIKALLDAFSSEGYDVTQINMIWDNLDALTSKENKPAAPVKSLVLKVSRPSTTIDTLEVECPYNKSVVEAFKRVPYMFFNKNSETWECYIEYSYQLWNELENLRMNELDMSELKPWAGLVKSWSKNYELLDIDKLTLKFKPYDFQPQDSKELLSKKWMLNANEVGCGKTFEQILIGESLPMKKLVICPPTLRINWSKEIQMVNSDANIHIIYSADDFKVVDGWNIIGYPSLDKFQKELETENFQCIMIDEAHYIQAVSNSGTPESKRAYDVLRLTATSNYVFPITGTPKTNRNKNLFNILRSIRHPLTRGKWAFANYGRIYCDGQNSGYGWNYNGNSNDEELNTLLTPFMVRHLKKDVLPNLKKQRVSLPIEVNLDEYKKAIADFLLNRENNNSESLVRLTKAKQVIAIQKATQSVEFARQFIDENKKVVIVTCFTEVVNIVEKAFKGKCLKIVGGMSDKAKNKAVEEFQNGTTPVIVINVVAGGTGITLTASNTMIVNDVPWTTGELEQAEGRIWRGGQTETAMIYYPMAVGCEMDELLIDTITYKSSTINTVVDGGLDDEINLRELLEKSLIS